MESKFIGVICDSAGKIYGVLNPDDDAELDKSELLQIKDATGVLTMVKVPREEYMQHFTMAGLSTLVARVKAST